MARLDAATRGALPTKDFALPGRKYPVNDIGHAKAALSRAKQNASPAQQATIKAKVATKFPSMAVKGTKAPRRHARLDGGLTRRKPFKED